MIKDSKIHYLIFGFFVWLASAVCGQAQTISAPTLFFTQACASPNFNGFNFSFSVSQVANLGPTNQFIVELSSATGSFTSPTVVATLPNTTTTVVQGSFNLPSNAYGEGYRIRVKSTSPVKTGGSSVVFPAYYAIHNIPFSINNNNGTVNICSGTPYTLSIDNTGTPSSPLFYPQLTYRWYRNQTIIPGETGSSINITQSGSYYAVTEYKSCTPSYNSYSNIVTVTIQSILSPQITAEGNAFYICPNGTRTLTSDTQQANFAYKWYRDNVLIPGAVSASYAAVQEGLYHLIIEGGGCVFETNAIELIEEDFSLDIDPSLTTQIIPGQSIPLSALTDASNPAYQWSRNNNELNGANQQTYNATQQGTYSVEVTEATPCTIVKDASVTLVYPDNFTLAVQTSGGYQSCASTSTILSVSQFDALFGGTATDIMGNSYGYSYQWLKDNLPVSGAVSNQLQLFSAAENGIYTLEVMIPDYGIITSNAVSVNLSLGNVGLSGPATICPGAIAALTPDVTDASYTYQWYKDGTLLPAITTPTMAADEGGDYYVIIVDGACSVQSSTLEVEVEQISLTGNSPSQDVILPGGTKSLSVTTDALGPQYTWYRNNVALPETGNTINATQDGEYKVVVSQTQGCNATAETIFTLSYPTGFTIAIAPSGGYAACASTSTVLTITSFEAQTPNGNINAANAGYQYQWYYNNAAIAGATGSALPINNATVNGNYYVIATVPFFAPVTSNVVAVHLALPQIAISGNTTVCEGSTVDLSITQAHAAYTYQWYKEGAIIPGATASVLNVSEAGSYYAIVTSGTCTKQSNTVTVQLNSVTVNVNVPATDIILPGQAKTISVTTNALAPQYTWYRNGTLLPETSATLNATLSGNYKVIVTQTSGCGASAETLFTLSYPSGFDLIINPDAAYQACNSTLASLNLISFTATTPMGAVDVANMGYAYQWYKDGEPVASAVTSSLILSDASQNGQYVLIATLPDYGTIASNPVNVNLELPQVVITNSNALCEGSSVVISSSLSASGYTYQWYKDSALLPGANSAALTATAEGSYYLVVTSGTCMATSNTIQLQIAGITVSSTNPAVDMIIPGQPKTLSVTTDALMPQYQWYKDGALLTSETGATLSATEDGVYKVEVTQTSGCNATEELLFTLQYPAYFTLTIAASPSYNPCATNNTQLTIANFTATATDGTTVNVSANGYPLQWNRDTTSVPSQTSSSIAIDNASQNGNYTLTATVPDFGIITSNNLSVNVSIAANSITIAQSGSLCAGGTVQLTATGTVTSYAYQWYYEGAAIPGSDQATLMAGNEGDYYLVVTAGSCTYQSETIAVQAVAISINSSNPAVDTILPGQTKTITVNSDAAAPVYEWYKDGVLLGGETGASLTATTAGNYLVIVTQTSGCNATAEALFTLQYPTVFSLAIVTDAAYNACISESAVISIDAFVATTLFGPVDVTNLGYQYQWYKDSDPISGQVGTTLTVNGALEGGQFRLDAILPGFGVVASNTLTVTPGIESVSIAVSGALCEAGTVQLSSDVNNAAYTYQWYKDNVAISGASLSNFTASEEGTYYLIVSYQGCSQQSSIVTLQITGIVVNSSNPASDILLPGQVKNISVTTDAAAPQFAWYRNNVLLPETAATIAATQDGEYRVVVTQTLGCNTTAEKTFVLNYPTGFGVNIATDTQYAACTSATVLLSAVSFTAETPNGPVDVTGMGYAYQWYRDEVVVSGATAATLMLNGPSQNGEYKLGVTIPEFGEIYSNPIQINLGIGQVILTASGLLCDDNSQVTLTSNVADNNYIYQWYKDGAAVATANPHEFIATSVGNYYLTITNGSCTFTSNIINVQQSDFSLTPASPLNDLIIPGEAKTLMVVTDALQPEFVWYRNGILQMGQSTSSLTITLAGQYKVLVTQTEQCVLVKEITFEITNPSEYALTIAPQNYESCVSTQAPLFIAEFKAVTEEGFINLIGNDYDYDYQWYKNGAIVPGANQVGYTALETGIYTLEVNIPGYGLLSSNSVAIELAFTDMVTISTPDVFCADGTEVTLYSNVSNTEYQYAWYHDGASLIVGAGSSVTVSDAGSYYLTVTYNGCTVTSNTLVLVPYDVNQVTISASDNEVLPEGTMLTVTAGGAESYTWFLDTLQIATGNSVEITEPGVYTMVAQIGTCEVSRQFTVTLKENNLIAIPNVISPNNDGRNDKWSLPLEYINENTEVVIYGSDGSIVLKQFYYDNNWPETDFVWTQKSPVYYYTIMVDNKITRRGSITLVK